MIESVFWRNKKVLITGHTGFKGSWLSLWLQLMGTKVYGLALDPPTQPSLFVRANVALNMTSILGDIRDLSVVKKVFSEVQPDIVIHMAAQALVRYSYQNPVETYQINVMGTMHVLEAIRACESVRAVVMVTTDKCYDNKEWIWPYRENEAMGGHDPYSSSKGCAELLIDSYRKSYFFENHQTSIATARAGNVIGGGDWAEDRLIPDVIKSFCKGEMVEIRNPNAVRPWQYVLEPLSGYLLLAEKLFTDGDEFAEAWNFGPRVESAQPVHWIVEYMVKQWKGATWSVEKVQQLHEAQILKLDSTKAYERLAWKARWTLAETLMHVTEWYLAEQAKMDMKQVCFEQIEMFNRIECN